MTDVKHRLALMRHTEEASGNVAMTCRYFGITRHTEYRWRRRFDELGWEG
jgi:transposase-like protein